MESIPSNIDFARKKPKAEDEFEKMNELSLQALACSILHPSVTRFWALHLTTMEE
jgi:hypothetical protein